jgi:hypothetical protein
MEWPLRDPQTCKPKSTPTNVAIWSQALQAASSEHPDAVAAWQRRLDDCSSKNTWRRDYISLLEEFARLQIHASPATLIATCRAGYAAAHEAFQFRSASSDDRLSLAQAWEAAFRDDSTLPPLTTHTHCGGQVKATSDPRLRLGSPHGSLQKPLYVYGADAAMQAQAWATYGCMEESAFRHAAASFDGTAAASVVVESHVFVLLGVTSELGPARSLLRLPGAHVVGVARAGPKLERLVEYVRDECPMSATLQVTHANMLAEGPHIARWLVDLLRQIQPTRKVVLMPMAYMDGEANVRIVMAMEEIVTQVKQRMEGCTVAYYISPATCHTIPPACARDAATRYETRTATTNLWRLASWGTWFQPSDLWKQLSKDNKDEESLVLYNGLVHLQGPNYALAKTLQLWRCMMAIADGEAVVPIMAPPTRTDSVTHNVQAAAALEGLPTVAPPNVSFDIAGSSNLLTAILLHKLTEVSLHSPLMEGKPPQHPMELFWDGAVHGGLWRCPYRTDSCGVLAYLYGRTLATPGSCPSGAMATLPPATEASEENV